MNSINSHSIAGRSLGLFLSLILAGSAYAGPGIQYWQSLGKPKAEPATKICTDHQVVRATVMEPVLPNGRGPLHAVDIGPKVVCTSCAGSSTVMLPSLANGRGPLHPVAVAATRHYCNSSCVPSNTSTVSLNP